MSAKQYTGSGPIPPHFYINASGEFPASGIPSSEVLKKLEVTNIESDSTYVDLTKQNFMNSLADFGTDTVSAENSFPKRNPSASRSTINLRLFGTRSGVDDLSLTRHSEMFIGFTDKDPRGTSVDPDYRFLRKWVNSKSKELVLRMGDNNDGVEGQRPWMGQEISHAKQDIFKKMQRDLKIFSTERENQLYGTKVSAWKKDIGSNMSVYNTLEKEGFTNKKIAARGSIDVTRRIIRDSIFDDESDQRTVKQKNRIGVIPHVIVDGINADDMSLAVNSKRNFINKNKRETKSDETTSDNLTRDIRGLKFDTRGNKRADVRIDCEMDDNEISTFTSGNQRGSSSVPRYDYDEIFETSAEHSPRKAIYYSKSMRRQVGDLMVTSSNEISGIKSFGKGALVCADTKKNNSNMDVKGPYDGTRDIVAPSSVSRKKQRDDIFIIREDKLLE